MCKVNVKLYNVDFQEGSLVYKALSRASGAGRLSEGEIQEKLAESKAVAESQKTETKYSKVYGVRWKDGDAVIYNPAIYLTGKMLENLRNHKFLDTLYEI